MPTRRPRHLPVLLSLTALLLAAATASAATNPVTIILRPAQIGAGYQLKTRSDSSCVTGCVTLDLCGYAFKTESLRSARAQVNYFRPGVAVPLSNEVVIYRGTGAAKALAEVGKAIATCPRTPVKSSVQGIPPLSYRLRRFRDPTLLTASVALEVHVSGRSQGKPVSFTDVYIYQVRKHALSIVYAYPAAGVKVEDELAAARHAATASAANLRRVLPG